MVTSRRQIDREEDRYGGYEQDIAAERQEEPSRRTVSDSVRRVRESRTVTEEPGQTVETVRRPASVVRPAYPNTERDYDRTIAPSRPSRYSEVMPEVRRREEPISIVKEQRLTAGTKRMLVVYLALVLAVVTAIIITGIVASNIRTDISALESDVESRTETLASIEAGMDEARDAALVWAGENMTPPSGTNTYEELVPGSDADLSGQVFDSIRDWFNSVFGG